MINPDAILSLLGANVDFIKSADLAQPKWREKVATGQPVRILYNSFPCDPINSRWSRQVVVFNWKTLEASLNAYSRVSPSAVCDGYALFLYNENNENNEQG